MTNDEKWFNKKMDRREFLKKAGIGGAGLALGVSGASAFFAIRPRKIRNSLTVRKKSALWRASGGYYNSDAEEYLLCYSGFAYDR